MRAVIQRVTKAHVNINQKLYSQIGPGYLIFLGIETDDDSSSISWLIKKITSLKLFEGVDGRMSESLMDINGQALVVSQFTLHASTKKGTRPSFHRSAPPEQANLIYQEFLTKIEAVIPERVRSGVFAEMMEVSLVNDGPVTILLDSKSPE